MKLLLLSNSSNKGEDYLEYPKNEIINFLGQGRKKILFFPFAAVTVSYDEYEILVADRLERMGEYQTTSIHRSTDYHKAIEEADAFVVGGGNTFVLLDKMQKLDLIHEVSKKVKSGIPYIGWSAGANIACPSIGTTNDMPVIWPETLYAMNLVPFQINPHFSEKNPEGFAGETREMRIREFIHLNPGIYVVGLREGSLLAVNGKKIELIGSKKARIYLNGKDVMEISAGEDLQFLLNSVKE